MIRIQPFDIGCEPSPSVPAEMLIQTGWSTFLLFFAVSKTVDETGHLADLRVAVLECTNCATAKFGYPNDEGLPEHPLYKYGLNDHRTSIMEVVDSPWVKEIQDQRQASAARIWGARGMSWKPDNRPQLKHFIIPLKEQTFECVASGMVVKEYFESFDDALAYVRGQMEQED